MPDGASRREAADPSVVTFQDEYYLFASKSGGYWYSSDLVDWEFVETDQIPTEQYAPTVITMRDTIFFLASSRDRLENAIYKSGNPKSGQWTQVRNAMPFDVWDPAFFQDDDERLYMYWGCSNRDPIRGIELDPITFDPISDSIDCIAQNFKVHGWERPGDYNEIDRAPWIEGPWMTKHEGKYYLQYAGPGTEFKSYADGVYEGGSPLGPFTYAKNNPFSYKPEGFINGAGHGSTFKDRYGNYWHMGTMTVYVKDWFERRLGLFPTYFDGEGNLVTDTGFGDTPFYIPNKKVSDVKELNTNWMLLSYNKEVSASSQIDSLPVKNAVDENVRTYWSAVSGDKGEWYSIDLLEECDISAIQVNFYDHGTQLFKRDENIYYQYVLEYSKNGANWVSLINKENHMLDTPHDYIQLENPVKARYIRLTSYYVPDGNFALSDLRVFGKGMGPLPNMPKNIEAIRNQNDRREVLLTWDESKNADGYIIQYGISKDKLYHSYKVYGKNTVTIRSLNANQDYCFRLDAFNENGLVKNRTVVFN